MRLLALLFFAACTHRTRVHVEREPARGFGEAQVAEPQFLVDHGGDVDPFRANTVVGNVTFAGGYVTETVGSGLHNVSKEVRIDDQDRYRAQVADWLTQTIGATAALPSPPPPPRRTDRRGTSRHDGRDNTSLPRGTFTPVAGGTFERPTWVPWVITYASHNGGWFYGQEYGSAGGARVRVLLVAHAADGSVLGWTDIDGSRTSDRVFSPTGPQLQDWLIALEQRVGRRLDRAR